MIADRVILLNRRALLLSTRHYFLGVPSRLVLRNETLQVTSRPIHAASRGSEMGTAASSYRLILSRIVGSMIQLSGVACSSCSSRSRYGVVSGIDQLKHCSDLAVDDDVDNARLAHSLMTEQDFAVDLEGCCAVLRNCGRIV